ncbi:hypothetical protein [Mesonia phycicola]|nr:hypothetical protein [Mesonia phycicola]
MKLGGLHAISHIKDKDHAKHCTICHHSIVNDLTPALQPEIQDFSLEKVEVFVKTEISKDNHFLVVSAVESNELLPRPPPNLI